jgi:hypothetical protein
MMGWTNVVMAGIDVELETGAIQALARGTVTGGLQLGRGAWTRILKARRQGLAKLAEGFNDLKLPPLGVISSRDE